jgi:hypothetical protein
MKKNLFLIAVLHCLVFKAQLLNFDWAKSMSGSATATASGNSIAVDTAGNVYSVGNFKDTVDFDPGAGIYTLTCNSSSVNSGFYLSKLDVNGNFVWAKSFVSTSNSTVTSIALDSLGDTYITGSFNGTLDFDPNIGTFSVASAGSYDAFILKINSSGNFVWVKTISSVGAAYPLNPTYGVNPSFITIDKKGKIHVGGSFFGIMDFDPGAGVYNLDFAGGNSVFILKLDNSGNFIWAKNFGGALVNLSSIAVDLFENVYIAGTFWCSADFDPGSAVYNLNEGCFSLNKGNYLSKLDSTGAFVWATSNFCWGWAGIVDVEVDAVGNVYWTGTTVDGEDLDPGPATYTLSSVFPGTSIGFVTKLDVLGNLVFARVFNASGGHYLQLDALGNIYITGLAFLGSDLDPGPGTYTLPVIGSGVNASDIYVSMLDTAGNFLWAGNFSALSNEAPSGFFVDAANNAHVIGIFSSTVDFDPNAGTYALSSANKMPFVCKLGNYCVAPTPPNNVTPINNQQVCATKSATLFASGIGTAFWYASANSTNALGSGSVFITPTLTAGTHTYYAEAYTCTNSVVRTAITLSVLTLPTINVVSSSSIICANSTATLTASGAISYQWSDGSSGPSTVIAPSVNTPYSVAGTGANGCSDSISFVQPVLLLPLINIVSTPSVICPNYTATLTASGAVNYQWNTGTSGSNLIVNPLVTTLYSVLGTDANGCSNSTSIYQLVLPFPSINVTSNASVACSGSSIMLTATGGANYQWNTGTTGSSLIVSPTITTLYKVLGMDVNGCSDSVSILQTVIALPSLSIASSSGVVCSGSTVTLTASGALNYNWNTGASGSNLIVSPTTTALYRVLGTDLNGCSDSISILQPVIALPSLSIASNPSIVCIGSTVTLTANGAVSYQWNTGASGLSIVISPSVNTLYSVVGTDSNGCFDSTSVVQNVSLCTGIFNASNHSNFVDVYPNPSSGEIWVNLNNLNLKEMEFKIENLLGQSLVFGKVPNDFFVTNISGFTPGLYFLRIEQEGKLIASKRIVKQ